MSPCTSYFQASFALSSCSSCLHLLRIDVLRVEGTMTTTRNNTFLVRMKRFRDPQSSPVPPTFSNSHLTSTTSSATPRCILRPCLELRSPPTKQHRTQLNHKNTIQAGHHRQPTHPSNHSALYQRQFNHATPLLQNSYGDCRDPSTMRFKELPLLRLRAHMHGCSCCVCVRGAVVEAGWLVKI